jgi:hypothetical protein
VCPIFPMCVIFPVCPIFPMCVIFPVCPIFPVCGSAPYRSAQVGQLGSPV